ncbi:jmjC domain-containing protein 8 isoform X1 [Vidua macroura]|uniref:jmjC domain-containing protein 8 isoform X1 n=1 Tax=Vidua macroura TaxID=187451 RepID=UPI0023A7C9D0|nr:jmjC domain-containing protein 8 isoform X1 [Vidua macroura]
MAAARLLPLLLLPLGWVRPSACTDPPGGGWLAGTVPEEPRCTVERADASLTYSLFLQRFAFSRPVILGGVTDNSAFRALCTREKLLAAFGPFPVRLSTANTYSYRKVDVPFQEYVEHLLKPQDPARLGSALRAPSLPHPGHQPRLQLWDRRLGLWRSLPLARPWFLRGDFRQEAPLGLSPRGCRGPGRGRAPGALQRWFLYPPDQTPHFHPNETTLAWLQHTYPTLPPAQRPLECTLRPGEVLYFPDRWWHATLNLDTSVFISTFLG